MKNILIFTIALILPTLEASAQIVGLNDAQILGILIAANNADIAAGKLAKFKGSDKEVSFFAQRMVMDHGLNLDSVTSYIKRKKIQPQESPASLEYEEYGRANIKNLKPLRRKAFQKAYIDKEVAFHGKVLSAIDSLLIPNVQNVELKWLLEKVRPAFVSHLHHAIRVQKHVDSKTE